MYTNDAKKAFQIYAVATIPNVEEEYNWELTALPTNYPLKVIIDSLLNYHFI